MMEGLRVEYSNDSEVKEAEKRREELDKAWKKKLESRVLEKNRKEAEKKEIADPTQNVDAYQQRFKELVEEVDNGIMNAEQESKTEKGISRAELTKRLDELLTIVNTMQNELAAATLYLPPYDIRQSSEKIAKATSDIEKARTSLAPRKKFAFGSKKKKASSNNNDIEAKQTQEQQQQKKNTEEGEKKPRAAEVLLEQLKLDANELVISDKQNETIQIEASMLKTDQAVRFRDIQQSSILMPHQTGAVRFIGLKSCKIYIGPIAGSCFFENCHDCVFMIASRQIRIHDSTKCDFYLHVLSRPIIEHCSELRFAPYRFQYPDLQQQIKSAGLDEPRAQTMWKDVDDFRWLRQQQSPNWSIMPEQQQLSHTI